MPNAPLNHVVQKAPVVDLPFGWSVFPRLLESPHHVTCCRGYKSKEVTIPEDAPILRGLQSHRDGRLHGCREDERKQGGKRNWSNILLIFILKYNICLTVKPKV